MQFHVPKFHHVLDRGFITSGLMRSVKIEYTSIIEKPEDSPIIPCNSLLTGFYDECAYREVGIINPLEKGLERFALHVIISCGT